MQKEKVNSREAILKHITKIDEYFNNKEHVPESEGHEALLMIGMYAKEKAKYSFRVSDLKINHNCYHTLQKSYRIISKETSFALDNITDENLSIIIGQFGILQYLEYYLEGEKDIPLNILMEMDARTVKGIKESEKVFKKINNVK